VVDGMVTAAHRRGGTVLVVTHDPTRAGLASRVVMMRAGRLRDAAAPAGTAAVRS
jgi:ABC-type lipoprotein export system ATPase subunit